MIDALFNIAVFATLALRKLRHLAMLAAPIEVAYLTARR